LQAAAGQRGELALDELLRDAPHRFGFFQAVRLLKRLDPERHPVGGDVRPAEEVVRFHAHLSLTFPPSEIVKLEPAAVEGYPTQMSVAFMGLTGPSGALPRHYTELLLERARFKDFTLRDFFDLFNHRLISLFYRAWEKHRFWIGYEAAELAGRQKQAAGPQHYRAFCWDERPRLDRFSQCLLDIAGLGTAALRYQATRRDELSGRTAIADSSLRFYAGLLAQQHRSASGLEGLLSQYFDLCARIEQLHGQWLRLELENQSCLCDGGNALLGANAVIGESFWDVQGKFRIRLGPLGYRQFRDFLPPGTAFRPLAQLARLYAGSEFDIDVQLVLRAAEVPCCRLGENEDDPGTLLGWETWLCSENIGRDVDDTAFSVPDEAFAV
jgi:type VI secretion system protein ImpH